jgi:hypothetical protein
MSFSVTPLLLDGEWVSNDAQEALRAAYRASGDERRRYLENAARLLHRSGGLDCADALELVGLPTRRGGAGGLDQGPARRAA